MMVGPAIMYSTSTLLGFVVSLTVMLSIDARLTLWSLIPLPFVSISVKSFGSAIHTRFERIQAQMSDLSAVAQEALAGVRVVRAYRQEASELERFRRANAEYLDGNRRLVMLQGFFFPSMAFFLGLAAALVLWLGSRDVIQGRITVGQFVAFNLYLAMLSWPMIAFGWVTNMIQRGMASWKRMLEVLDTVPAITDETVARPTTNLVASERHGSPTVRGEIEVRDLVFAYNGALVLDHVSARIEAGQTVALVGMTGSGKSTLISLLARLYDPPRGTMFIDGVDVRDLRVATLRGAIGLVPQEPFLFSDTLADNIAFGLDAIEAERGAKGPARAKEAWAEGGGEAGRIGPSERRQRIEQAAAVARLDKDVVDFPKGYDTVVGERGITLSGGQKQRTAIARAVVIDPRILILDDALSSVDTYTEEEILSRLRAVMRQRTSIIVSHRISTVRGADQIFVLDSGRIVERGTHDDLLRLDGLYATLHRRQLLEDELAAL
jgi:ATP-binding cassette subfamily B protein